MRRRSFLQDTKSIVRSTFRFRETVLLVKGIAYFPIPKNANSRITTVFLRNCPDAGDFDPEAISSFAYMKKNRACVVQRFADVEAAKATTIAVIRHPAKRLVSSFLNKFVVDDSAPRQLSRFTDDAAKVLGRPIEPAELRFADLLAYCRTVPDWRRNPHIRSQSSFLPRRCDRLFDLDSIDALWTYLQERGFDVSFPETAHPKNVRATSYAAGGGHRGAARLTIAELSRMSALPAYSDFFDEAELAELIRGYRRDVELYCEVVGISVDDFRSRILA